MARWREVLRHVVNDVETQFDKLKYGLEYRLGSARDPIKIVPYTSYGTRTRLYLQGRVLEDPGLVAATDNDTLWDNLLNTYKRMESDEIPFARLVARAEGEALEIEADEEGMFAAWMEFDSPLPDGRLWQTVTFELLEPQADDQDNPVTAEGKVFLPPSDADYGVISDIDDTVIEMGVGDLLKAARAVFLSNARTRLPFPGVAALYRALHAGPGDEEQHNPLFFVSSSPWNLYDLLVDFFHLNDIPNGPILTLRNYGITEDEILPLDNRPYKTGAVRRIIDLYPDLPFILIGDSTQQDPEIYAEIVDAYPNRVQAIYIRNIKRKADRPEAVRELGQEVVEAGSELLLVDDSLTIAKHALDRGWISADAMPEIRGEKAYDEGAPEAFEEILAEE